MHETCEDGTGIEEAGDEALATADAILSDPSVRECVITERRTRSGGLDRIAYVVVDEPDGFDILRPQLSALAAARVAAFVPVRRIPATAAGAPDLAALADLPVWSDDSLAAWEDSVAGCDGIDRVACIAAPDEAGPRHLHVGRLLRDLLPAAPTRPKTDVPAAIRTADTGTAPPALCHGGPLPEEPDGPATLPDLLRRAPADTAIIHVAADGTERASTYGALLEAAQRVLGRLRRSGLDAGDTVILQLERTEDILHAFWACMLGGIRPVITSVPVAYDTDSRSLDHLKHVWALLDRPPILAADSRVEAIRHSALGEGKVAAIEDLRDGPPDPVAHQSAPDDIAFFTLSSGSTGLPKAVTITHRNVLARARGVNLLCGHDAADVILNWLPFDHIGSISDWHIRCVALGCRLVYAPKELVLGRPLRWLDLIHRHRITHSWAPNFAYSLVTAALKTERPGDWDLSCVRGLLTAGEMITETATRDFLGGLAPYGLAPSVLRTAFGMAEMGSGTTYHLPRPGRSLTFHHIARDSLGGALRVADADDDTAVSFASLGAVIPGMSVRIVDDRQQVVPEGIAGYVHFSGAAVSPGYYRTPEANAVFLADGWFDTGDVGFIRDRELVLTGRADAGIIINGANFYNNEIESAVEQVDGITASFTAACAVRDTMDDAQKLAVFFHTPLTGDAVLPPLLRAIQTRLAKQLGIKADYLIPVDQETIPKTAIGKIQHKRLIRQFQEGAFAAVVERVDLLTGNERTLPNRFHRRVWLRKEPVNRPQPPDGLWLVVLDRPGHGVRLEAALTRAGLSCVTVSADADPRDVIGQLAGRRLDTIVHLAATEPGYRAEGAIVELVRALAATAPSRPVRLMAVSSQALAIGPDEATIPGKAALSGLLAAFTRALPWLDCRHIDCPDGWSEAAVALLAREVRIPSADDEIALRDGQRWIPALTRMAVAAEAERAGWRNPFKRNGTYVIANGLDGLGPYLAEFLLGRFQARLLLLGAADGDEAGRTALLRRLGTLGGTCDFAAIPAGAPDGVRETVESVAAAWGGTVDGIIHLPADRPTQVLEALSSAALTAALDEEAAVLHALSLLARERRDCPLMVVSPIIAGGGNAQDAGRPIMAAIAALHQSLVTELAREGVPLLSCGLATLTAANPAEGERALAALLVGLRLGRARPLIGAADGDPAIGRHLADASPALEIPTAFYAADHLATPEDLGLPAFVDTYGEQARCRFVQMREPETAAAEQMELWPSVAEYFVYDDLIYYALANDERRNRKYVAALERTVKDKVVVDIGTGKEAILARLALAAGARKVYAVEKGDEAYALAAAHVARLGLDDRISIIHGEAGAVSLPEPADVCVSEIVGPIGGCEGAAVIINDCHRLLRPDGIMIPTRSVTVIAAATLPDELRLRPGFHRVPASYTEKIFAEIGHPFDLRICVKKFPAENLLSPEGVFEYLDFSRPIAPEESHAILLPIDRKARLDGFLVWLKLHTIDGEVIDILEHEYSWLPVYMPVFEPGIEVEPGDRIKATVTRSLCDNGFNPDYVIDGALIRADGTRIPFTHASYHHRPQSRPHPFYERLFRDDPYGRLPSCRPGTPLHYLPELPVTATGRIDRLRLAARAAGDGRSGGGQGGPASDVEKRIAEVWRDILGVSEVGLDDSFFELGGHSLLLVQAHNRLVDLFGPQVPLVDLFKYPTVRSLAAVLADGGAPADTARRGTARAQVRARVNGAEDGRAIAVIGLSCRFPGADDPETFWRNLASGTESIAFFSDEEVLASGIDPALVRNPAYVKASPILSDVESFDAEFFGYGAAEAALMDPQQRLLLECGWEALENAGYDPFSYPGDIAVYAGASMNTYLLNNVHPNRDALDALDSLEVTTLDSMGGFQLMVANDKDYLPTRLSYKLNLRGPSLNVQTACSTGLVVIHLGCQALLAGEADMVLAAGSAVQIPHRAGHLYQDGMIVSPDGHCRAFDAEAKGTVFGSGVGVVLLKRLDDALRDGDHVWAVVKGSAVNNDGGLKVGYMAPSGEGEAAAVAEALAVSGVDPDTIGFVEAHGTGTEMGDPIEVSALTQAFRPHTQRTGFCAIGSVKTNIGHLQIASGMAGFFKATLALDRKAIPPSLHFDRPNPAIDFDNSPFYVATSLTPWPETGTPRRAGVNSLGIGGTNAHVILEEAPPPRAAAADAPERPRHILMLSARSEAALAALARRYHDHLRAHPDLSLADVCFTANTGRKAFDHRLAVCADSLAEMAAALDGEAATAARGRADGTGRRRVAFLFTGQGSQYAGMGRQLYDTQPGFRRDLETCAAILDPLLDRPLLEILYPADDADPAIHETAYAQPALFAVAYALARLWMAWGITPSVVMGHSLGEYVAACIAGLFSLEDALTLVAARARLMQALPRNGEMMAVFASREDLQPLLTEFAGRVSVAAENGPRHLALSGLGPAMAEIRARLAESAVATHPLRTSHAFHSPLMEPMLADFARIARQVRYSPPRIDLVSNLSGRLESDRLAEPDYWCRHIREPVRFMAGLASLVESGCDAIVEIGPKPVLLGMAADNLAPDTIPMLPSLAEGRPDWERMLDSLAQLAVRGPVDWAGLDGDYARRRLPLPTYPFQRQRYWLDPPARSRRTATPRGANPLAGRRLPLPALGAMIHEIPLDPDRLPFLGDHRIYGDIVVSGACHLSMILTALGRERRGGSCAVKDVCFLAPLILGEGESPMAQVIFSPAGIRVTSLLSDGDDDEPMATTHVEAVIDEGDFPAPAQARDAVWARCPDALSPESFYQTQADRQIRLGLSYRWMRTIRLGDGEAVCVLAPPASLGGLAARPLHPGLLDAAFGLLLAAAPLAEGETWLPFAIEAVRLHHDPRPEGSWAHLLLRRSENDDVVAADIRLYDGEDRLALEFVGLEGRRARREEILKHRPGAARGWTYVKEWRALETAPDTASPGGRWLLLADRTGVAEDMARRLRADGAQCLLAFADSAYGSEDGKHYRLDPARPADFDRLLAESGGGYDGVIHLWGLDEPEPAKADGAAPGQGPALAGALHLLQSLDKAGATESARLWLVTRGALAAEGETRPPEIGQSPLWGMGLTVALEYPGLSCTCVDIDPESDRAAAELAATVACDDGEGEILWRRGLRHGARLVARPDAGSDATLPVSADGTVLITGGLGALGLLTAQWLVERGARHLVLMGRTPPTPAAAATIRALERSGATLHVALADLGDQSAVAREIQAIGGRLPPLRGIVHAAGGLADGMVADQDWNRFGSIFAAKMDGAWTLHRLTRDADLDFFVLFSSAASVLGNPGQANYAAANAFLDGLAQYRRALGLPATTINWGPWEGVGMAASPAIRTLLGRQGFAGIAPEAGLALLGRVLAANLTQICVVDADWPTHVGQLPRPRPLFDELAPPPAAAGAEAASDFAAPLSDAPPEERRALLLNLVGATLRRLLGLGEDELESGRPLTDQGLDSLMAVQLRNGLAHALQRSLPVSLVFNYPTAMEIVEFLDEQFRKPIADRPQRDSTRNSALELLSDIDDLLGASTSRQDGSP